MKPLIFLFAFAMCLTSFGQKKKKEEADLLVLEQQWYEGSIMLSDGTELKGLVMYNDKHGFVSYQDGTTSKALTPRSVVGFEFFDERVQKQRVFYTFEYEDSRHDVKQPLFFEVLKEFKTFAILIKDDPIEAKHKVVYDPFHPSAMPVGNNMGFPSAPSGRTVLEVSQSETVYIMDDKGNIKPYFTTVNKEDGTKSLFTGKDTKTKSQMIDEDVLAEYIGEEIYNELRRYAKENDLKFKMKADFLKILNYYESLVK